MPEMDYGKNSPFNYREGQYLDSYVRRIVNNPTRGRMVYTWDADNNREQLIDGDTGWRAIATWTTAGVITGSMPPGFIPQVGKTGGFFWRRLGYMVYLSINGATTNAGSQQIPIPDGFSPGGAPFPYVGMVHTNAGVVQVASIPVGWTDMWSSFPTGTLISSSDSDYGSTATWATISAWPTSLPGVAYGPIPNL